MIRAQLPADPAPPRGGLDLAGRTPARGRLQGAALAAVLLTATVALAIAAWGAGWMR